MSLINKSLKIQTPTYQVEYSEIKVTKGIYSNKYCVLGFYLYNVTFDHDMVMVNDDAVYTLEDTYSLVT